MALRSEAGPIQIASIRVIAPPHIEPRTVGPKLLAETAKLKGKTPAAGRPVDLDLTITGYSASSGGMALLVGVLEDIKTGALDADRNGRISLAEIREYIRKRGKEALKPAFVAEVVRIVTSTLTPSENQRALEEAAAKLA